MKPAQFGYHSPDNLAQALEILAALAPAGGKVLAGGQSLVPAMAFRLAQPSDLIDINNLPLASDARVADGELVIGALVRHTGLESGKVPGPLGHLLATIVGHIAHFPIRTRGTFCGSLANADPASEWCLVAKALGAKVIVQSVRGQRILEADAFFPSMFTTALEPDEILIEARLPLLPAGTRVGFDEFSRRRGDFAMAMALVTYALEDGRMSDVRVAVGGVEEKARRIGEAESLLDGQAPASDLFAKAAERAAQAVEPIEDAQTPAIYRRDLTIHVVRQALLKAAA